MKLITRHVPWHKSRAAPQIRLSQSAWSILRKLVGAQLGSKEEEPDHLGKHCCGNLRADLTKDSLEFGCSVSNGYLPHETGPYMLLPTAYIALLTSNHSHSCIVFWKRRVWILTLTPTISTLVNYPIVAQPFRHWYKNPGRLHFLRTGLIFSCPSYGTC